MLSCLASAITIICAKSVRSALRTTSLTVPFWNSTFFVMWLKVLSFAFVRVLWSLTFGGLDSNLSLLKRRYAFSRRFLGLKEISSNIFSSHFSCGQANEFLSLALKQVHPALQCWQQRPYIGLISGNPALLKIIVLKAWFVQWSEACPLNSSLKCFCT